MRVKNLRDGMEDYEYFAILEKLAGRSAVKKPFSPRGENSQKKL
ncbi:MAG: hypothetical protein ACYTEK_28260 [Planctomycetota bacterium]